MSVLVCPVCQGAMKEITRDDVLIDACTQCRGVWLDRGELEKIATALGGAGAPPPPPSDPYPQRGYEAGYRRKERDWDDDDDDRRHHGHGRPHQKSKLSRLMDFFD